jgi:uncharacterized membrane protein YjjB (DUF3815 family)
MASFSLGIVSNLIARYKDQIAVSSLTAGIFWLVPGSIGVKGIATLLTKGEESDFVMQIILRIMSIAIGLYVSNIVVYPMSPKEREEQEDEFLAI